MSPGKVAGDEVLSRRFAPLLGLTERLLTQERTSKNKLYSLHAPEVVWRNRQGQGASAV